MAPFTAALRVWFAVVLVVTQLLSHPPEILRSPSRSLQLELPGSPASVAAQDVRISQVYGGGGASGAFPCDFVELFNASSQPVSLQGWSVQFALATLDSWQQRAPLGNATIPAHGYFLFGNTYLTTCPATPSLAPDVTGRLPLSTADGKVALARTEGPITGINDPNVVDFVGYGQANAFEGSGPTPRLSPTTAALRADGGCTDTDDNAADFTVGAVAPRNSTAPLHSCAESAPTVLGTLPGNGATSVAPDVILSIDFSEPVTLDSGWFELQCDLSGTRDQASSTVAGGPTSYTIDPSADFLPDEACRLTVFANAVHDADANDPPDLLTEDYVADFRTVAGQCGDRAYAIHDIQGQAASSPAVGRVRTVEAVVTGDFQGAGALSGYFLQEVAAAADADPYTSEAIFVDEQSGSPGDVSEGSRMRVTGTVAEMQGMTALTGATSAILCPPSEPPPPVDLSLPLVSPADWEQYEGMLVRFNERLTVAGSDELASRGRLTLVRGSLPLFYTQQHSPDVAGFAEWESDLARSTLVLDDGSDGMYLDPFPYPPPGLSAANTVRAGDGVEAGLTGILDARGGAGVIHPTGVPTFVSQAPRPPAPPRAGGNVRVSFLSLGDYFNVTGGLGGPLGASTADEFGRQRAKLVSALLDLDADVVAVSRLENDGFGPGSALADLAEGLNQASAPGTYAFVDLGLPTLGGDVVTVAILYRPASVVPIGAPASLSSGAFNQTPPVHRAPLAQTFEERVWGERFTVVVNEWQARGGCPATGVDADAGDGQGCWNASRTAAAVDLRGWLALDPTASGDPDILVLGELNAFSREDPIQQLTNGGFIDLVARDVGPTAVTALVEARAGYSDHGLASPPAAVQVVGVSVWAINAEEPAALDYQMENKSLYQQSSLYATDPYRSSDQNPVIVDLDLAADQGDLGDSYGTAWHTGQGVWRLGEQWSGADDGVVGSLATWNDGQGELTVSVNGPAEQFACLYGWLDYSDGTVSPGTVARPDGDWDENEGVIGGVPLSPGADQAVTFPLPAGVLGQDALNMRLRLVPAPNPLLASCQPDAQVPAAVSGPTGRADGGEVEDYSFEAVPLAVDLVSFTSRGEEQRVILDWETLSEHDLLGFHLHRGRSVDGPWEQVNPVLIPAHAPGSTLGDSYRYYDDGTGEGIVWHRLTAVDLHGQHNTAGLVQTRITGPNQLRLTSFGASTAPKVSSFAVVATAGSGLLLGFALVGRAWVRRRASSRKV